MVFFAVWRHAGRAVAHRRSVAIPDKSCYTHDVFTPTITLLWRGRGHGTIDKEDAQGSSCRETWPRQRARGGGQPDLKSSGSLQKSSHIHQLRQGRQFDGGRAARGDHRHQPRSRRMLSRFRDNRVGRVMEKNWTTRSARRTGWSACIPGSKAISTATRWRVQREGTCQKWRGEPACLHARRSGLSQPVSLAPKSLCRTAARARSSR